MCCKIKNKINIQEARRGWPGQLFDRHAIPKWLPVDVYRWCLALPLPAPMLSRLLLRKCECVTQLTWTRIACHDSLTPPHVATGGGTAEQGQRCRRPCAVLKPACCPRLPRDGMSLTVLKPHASVGLSVLLLTDSPSLCSRSDVTSCSGPDSAGDLPGPPVLLPLSLSFPPHAFLAPFLSSSILFPSFLKSLFSHQTCDSFTVT